MKYFSSLRTNSIQIRMPYYQSNKTSAVSIYIKILGLIFVFLCVLICIYYLLVLQGFWISAIASQSGTCNLMIYKNKLTCDYWSMFLEIVTWITIIYGSVVIIGTTIIVVIAFFTIVGFFCGLSIPILILMGEFFNRY